MLKIINYELKSKRDLVIAHISDIHYSNDLNSSRLKKIIFELKKKKPDYICITGDLVDNLAVTESDSIAGLKKFLEELSYISKVLIGLGNHDTKEYKGIKNNKWYKKLNKNLIVLDNSYYVDNDICFYGLTIEDDYYHHEHSNKSILYKEISKIKLLEDKYNILLFHSPINFEKKEIVKINNFDLVLVGHTHNGLTPHMFPGNFGIFAPRHTVYLKNARNSFNSGKAKVIISGGITKISPRLKIFYIFNNLFASDLNYIHLKKDKKN